MDKDQMLAKAAIDFFNVDEWRLWDGPEGKAKIINKQYVLLHRKPIDKLFEAIKEYKEP